MTTMTEQTTQAYTVFIRATPERVWDAITKPEFTTRYFYGSAVDSTFEPGAPYLGWTSDRAQKLVDGEVLESDPPRLLRRAPSRRAAAVTHRAARRRATRSRSSSTPEGAEPPARHALVGHRRPG